MNVHLCLREKFINPFITMVCTHFQASEHRFIVIGKQSEFTITPRDHVIELHSHLDNLPLLLQSLYAANRIFLHSLFDERLLQIIALQPWLLKKVYWIMWGGDLYRYQSNREQKRLATNVNERIRSFVIPRFAGYIGLRGDYELARQWYGVSAPLYEMFFYPSNLFQEQCMPLNRNKESQAELKILLGNSADPSNQHLELFAQIAPYINERCQLIVPLSYGNAEYRELVIAKGREMFGRQFIPLTDFIGQDEYYQILSTIDIGLFYHRRQQALSNLIHLLGYGAKVYLRDDVVTWRFFDDLGVTVYPSNSSMMDLCTPIPDEVRFQNQQVIFDHFSLQNWLLQMQSLFAQDVKDVQ